MVKMSPHSVYPERLWAEVISDVAAFKMLEAEWDMLLKQSGLDNIALRHPWLLTWLECFPQERLCVILVREASGRLVGAAPFKINTSPSGITRRFLYHLQFIGVEPCVNDWMQIICLPDADPNLIIDLIAEQLIRHKSDWDVLDLRYARDHLQLLRLVNRLSEEASLQQIYAPMSMSVLNLTADRDNIVDKRLRKNLRNSVNHLEMDYGPDAALLRIIKYHDHSKNHLDRFFQNHVEYWQAKGSCSSLKRFPALVKFYSSMLHHFDNDPQHTALLTSLEIDGKTASYHLGFLSSSGYLAHLNTYFDAFRRYRPGFMHIDALIRYVRDNRCDLFNFGRGDEPYKSHWQITKIPLWNGLVFRDKWVQAQWQSDFQCRKWLLKLKKQIP